MAGSGRGSVRTSHAQARSSFRALLIENPGYFTTKLPLAADTAYEKLTCVGYQPQLKRLQAIVSISQESGYD
jgi:hypothetical protein